MCPHARHGGDGQIDMEASCECVQKSCPNEMQGWIFRLGDWAKD